MSSPEWAKRVAESLGDGPHLVVSGISPSGNIHAGNLLEVLVAEAVATALRGRGDDVRFVFHADTVDPLRKIAPGVPASFEKYLGQSLSHIPDPYGEHESYAERFLAPFEAALRDMGMDIEVLRSHELYESGVYSDVTRESIEKSGDLRRILMDVSGREMPEEWSPFLPRAADGDMTGNRVIRHLPEENKVLFVDRGGNEGVADYSRGEGKLGWRVELAARWKALGATFEPFGKDHTSRGGSTDTADRMAREVFEYPIPGRYEYEWIGLKGEGAMSSSKGIVLLPEDLLEIMPPGAVRSLLLPREPSRAFDIDLTGGFPRFMDEYRARSGGASIPFTHLVTVAQTVGGDTELAAKMLRRGGYEIEAGKLADDLRYARNWADEWAPESMRMRILDPGESREAAESLDDEQRRYLSEVVGGLDGEMGDGEGLQNFLYSTAKELGVKPKRAFGAIYTVLIGKKSGPKAGPFVAGLPPEIVFDRLDVPDVASDTETGGGAG